MSDQNKCSFNIEGSTFMGAKRNPQGCTVGLFGVPYDGTTSFRPGSRFGPEAVRDVSNGIETFCPQLNKSLEDFKYVDLGSIEVSHGAPEPVIEAVKYACYYISNLRLKPLMIGGEHSITSGAIEVLSKKHKNLILIQLDAHADLREEWLGSRHNHACAMRRCLEVLPSKKLFQVGIRSGTAKEFLEMKEHNRLISHNHWDKATSLKEVLKPFLGNPLYLTIDLDWFDPSIVPGTGTPEPGGFNWSDFAAIVEVLKQHNLVGADVVELSPKIDTSDISSILAAKVIRSLIILLG